MPALLVLSLALTACGLPDWWPESLGGHVRHDRLIEGALREPLLPPALLPPLASLGPDGLRVAIAPSFSDFHYALDFVPQPLGCYFHPGSDFDQERAASEGCRSVEVRYVLIRAGPQPPVVDRRFGFVVPEEEFREAVGEFDWLARGWNGGDRLGLDGTAFGIEQFRSGQLRSMRTSNNAGPSPNNPAFRLIPHIHRMLLAYGPSGAVPTSDSFTVGDGDEFPCMANGFNAPDPDGFGTGDDACARSRRQNATSGNR